MLAISPVLALVTFALGVAAQSAVPSTAICPTTDQCGAPLCTGGADYSTDPFTCYYSQLANTQDCSYPLDASSNYYCLFSSTTGALEADQNAGCCAGQANAGVRPTRRMARGLVAAPPTPGTSASDSLRKRVDFLRAQTVKVDRRDLKIKTARGLVVGAPAPAPVSPDSLSERMTPTTTLEERVDLLRELTFDA